MVKHFFAGKRNFDENPLEPPRQTRIFLWTKWRIFSVAYIPKYSTFSRITLLHRVWILWDRVSSFSYGVLFIC